MSAQNGPAKGQLALDIFQLRPARRRGAKQAWQAAFIPDNWRFRFHMRKA